MTEYIDGHRWPAKAVSPETREGGGGAAPGTLTSSATSTERPDNATSDQVALSGASDLPPFEVRADYTHCRVALLFDPDHVPLLMRHPLFASSSRLLQGALIDCEQWIEEQIRDERNRQLRQVGR